MDDVVIWGAGAIGGTIGAYLARAGAKALLVDTDAAHVAALNATGSKITGPIEEFSVRVRAVTPDQVRSRRATTCSVCCGGRSATPAC